MRWQDITDEREKYAAYLCSPEWGQLRRRVIFRDSICKRCRVNPSAHAHHLTYARKYHEDLADLQGVCEDCHAFIHGRSAVDPAAAWEADHRLALEVKGKVESATTHEEVIVALSLLARGAKWPG